MRRLAGMCGALLALAVGTGVAEAQGLGVLAQLPGADGCHNATPADGCGEATTMFGAAGVVASADGSTVYVSSFSGVGAEPSIVGFRRAPVTGKLTKLLCVTADGTGENGEPCVAAPFVGAGQGRDLEISKDSRTLYSVSESTGALTVFQRFGDGTLHPVQCLSKTGSGGACADARGFGRPGGVTVSPDDRFVYVTGTDAAEGAVNTVTTFARDTATGLLTQIPAAGCLSADGSSPDADPCDSLNTLTGNSKQLVITPDGTHAYLVNRSEGVLVMLTRSAQTGILSRKIGRATCLSEDGHPTEPGVTTSRRCLSTAPYMKGPFDVTISPDGATLYVGLRGVAGQPLSGGIAIFRIDANSGSLAPLGDPHGCITGDGSAAADNKCLNGRAVGRIYGLETTPDGRSLYVLSADNRTLATLVVDPATGGALQVPGAAGCASASGTSPAPENATCTRLRGIGLPLGLATADNVSVYMSSTGSSEVPSRSLTVMRRQVPPVCSGFAAATPFQTPVTVQMRCSDPNGDPLTRVLKSAPAAGTIAFNPGTDGNALYTPHERVAGQERFAFAASDGSLESAPADVTVDIAPPPPAPPPPGSVPGPPDPPGPECSILNRAKPGARNVRKNGLDVKVRCKERAELEIALTMSRSAARMLRIDIGRARRIAVEDGAGLPGRSATIKLRLSKTIARRLAAASTGTLRRFRLTLGVTAKSTRGDGAQRMSKSLAFRR